jgi:peptidoglycan/xylan/chitin deacetylase (PgdA/CDA1 family)
MKILEYHGIVSARPKEIHAVHASDFAAQMAWLKQNGYRVAPLSAWISRSEGWRSSNTVAITFDDGYQDNYENALPVLMELGYPATIFLSTDLIGHTSRWRNISIEMPNPASEAAMLTWDQVIDMAEQGIEFGSHTASHTDLTALAPDEVDYEIRTSRQTIEEHLGLPVRFFSYPYSRSNLAIQRQVQEAGYLAACTYLPFYVGQAGKNPFELQRIGILAEDKLDDFSQKIKAHPRRRLKWQRYRLRQILLRFVKPLTVLTAT